MRLCALQAHLTHPVSMQEKICIGALPEQNSAASTRTGSHHQVDMCQTEHSSNSRKGPQSGSGTDDPVKVTCSWDYGVDP
jgi:hypothetical protein